MFAPDRESASGDTAAWDLMDRDLLVYDGVLLANVGRVHHGFDSLGMAFRPLWIGTLLNTIVYATCSGTHGVAVQGQSNCSAIAPTLKPTRKRLDR